MQIKILNVNTLALKYFLFGGGGRGLTSSLPWAARQVTYVCIFEVLGRVNISGHWRP